MTIQRTARGIAAALALTAVSACGSTGGLGNILGSVLGGAQGNQVDGTVQGVDTRSQQIGLQLSNGQSVALAYDANTRVVYQNRNYAVTALERGDQIVARVQSSGNGGTGSYYTDSVQVTQPVAGSDGTTGTTGSSTNVQSFQGIVRQVDQSNGQFVLDAGGGVMLTVSLPYNARQADVATFQRLRVGDSARLYGVYLNNTRIELRQFY
jgi:hypothetical protein